MERVKWVSGNFTRGIILEQRKEPALRRKLRTFLNANYAGMLFESDLPYDGAALSGKQIIEIARLARIVDERDGLFLHEKFRCTVPALPPGKQTKKSLRCCFYPMPLSRQKR